MSAQCMKKAIIRDPAARRHCRTCGREYGYARRAIRAATGGGE